MPLARIVVADDHEVVRKGIRAMLDRHPPLTVCGVAANGQEAIDKVLELQPDLVILDLSMPVVNGFQAAMKIRQSAPNVKVVIFSVHEASVVEQVSYLMGAHAFLKKSSSQEELVSTICSVLEGLSPSATTGSQVSRPATGGVS